MNSPAQPLLSFVGVGPPRTGTTWLAYVLNSHPRLRLPVGNGKTSGMLYETRTDFEASSNTKFIRSWDEYWRVNFPSVPPELVRGEVSPHVLYNGVGSAPLLHRHNPRMKLLVTLRDPVRRLYSQYLHLRRWGQPCPATFAEVLDHPQFLRHSAYYEQLQPWLEQFESDAFLFIFHDELKRGEHLLASLFASLGVTPFSVSDEALRPKNEGQVSRGYRRRIRAVARRLEEAGLAGLVSLGHRLGLPRLIERADLAPAPEEMPGDVVARLRERYAPDVERLEGVVGRDLTAWKIGSEDASRA